MGYLFGQTWIWLLIAFVLGIVAGFVLAWSARKEKVEVAEERVGGFDSTSANHPPQRSEPVAAAAQPVPPRPATGPRHRERESVPQQGFPNEIPGYRGPRNEYEGAPRYQDVPPVDDQTGRHGAPVPHPVREEYREQRKPSVFPPPSDWEDPRGGASRYDPRPYDPRMGNQPDFGPPNYDQPRRQDPDAR